ncbi:MAG TPA: hypothetical protein PK855_03685, partial [Bacteroidales bacterium]|nr:hypothetical protein [Bacteroidales bacterium]
IPKAAINDYNIQHVSQLLWLFEFSKRKIFLDYALKFQSYETQGITFDASKSIALIVRTMAEAIEEGLNERKLAKDKGQEDGDADGDDFNDDNDKSFDVEDEDGKGEGKKAPADDARGKRPRRPATRK